MSMYVLFGMCCVCNNVEKSVVLNLLCFYFRSFAFLFAFVLRLGLYVCMYLCVCVCVRACFMLETDVLDVPRINCP